MAKAKAGLVSADRIKSFLERIEKLLEERASISGDIRDVFSEAKGVGYDVKTLRKLIVIRAMDAADRAEQETLLDTYMHALGMEVPANVIEPTEEELIERASRIVSEVDQCMALAADGRPPKIADIQDLIGCSQGKAHKLRKLAAERISRTNQASVKTENENPPHDPETGELDESADQQSVEEIAAEILALPHEERVAAIMVVDALAKAPAVAAMTRPPPEQDDLEPPPFLDRRQRVRA